MKQGLWIPREILLLEDINGNEKLVLGAIANFSKKMGICTARNKTIAESVGLSLVVTEHAMAKLLKKRYITSTGRGPNRDIAIQPYMLNNSATEAELISHIGGITQPHRLNSLKKEKEKEKEKEKGKEMSLRDNPPHGDLINGGLKNDQERDEADTEQLLSDFWKQELGL